MKRLITIICLIAGCSLSMWAQIPTVSQESAHINLGKIKERRLPLEQNFFLCNEGHEPLAIQRLLSTCGCKIVAYSRDSIRYDEMGYISVYLTPPFKAGPFKHEIFVYTNLGTLCYTLEGEFMKSTYQHHNYTAIPQTNSKTSKEKHRKR